MKKNYLLLLFLLVSGWFYGQCNPQLQNMAGTSGTVTLSCGSLDTTGGYGLQSVGFPVAPRSSVSYSAAQSIAFSPVSTFSGAGFQEINLFPNAENERDEDFVAKIDLETNPIFGGNSFIFSLFGVSYPSFLISSNGFITFDQDIDFDGGETWSPSYFSEQPIPNSSLSSPHPALSIFSVFQDSEFVNGTSRLLLKVSGNAPCRTFAIHFENLRIKGSSELVTTQILLHEFSSEIDLFIFNKPNVTNVSAIVGITNISGGGIAVPNRNAGFWAASNEGWRFSPSGALLRRDIQWFKNAGASDIRLTGNSYNNRQTVTVFPEKIPEQKFIVKYIYYLPDGTYTITREINLKYSANYPLVQNVTEAVCIGTIPIDSVLNQKVSINPEGNFNFKYYEITNLTGAQNGDPSLTGSLDTNKSYYVRVESKTDNTCFNIAILKLTSTPTLVSSTVEICKERLTATNYYFEELECQLLETGFYKNARYRINQTSGTPVYTSKSRIPSTIVNGDQIYIWVDTDCGSDIQLGPVTVNINEGPDITTTFPSLLNVSLCKIIPINPISNKRYRFDWTQYFVDMGYLTIDAEGIIYLGSTPVIVTVHLTETAARNGTGALNYISNHSNFPNKVWIRVQEISGNICLKGCLSITEVDVDLSFSIILNVDDDDADAVPDITTEMDLETADIYLCRSTSARTLDLAADSDRIIKVPSHTSSQYRKTYHTSLNDANNLASNGVAPTANLPATTILVTRFVRYRVLDSAGNPTDCFAVKQLNYHVQTVLTGNNAVVNICYPSLPITVVLADHESGLLGRIWPRSRPAYNLKYYDASGKPITEFQFTSTVKSNTVFVETPSDSTYGSCSNVRVPVTFNAIENPVLIDNELDVNITCYNANSDTGALINKFDLTSLLPQFTSGIYSVRYYRTRNATTGNLGNEIRGADITGFTLSTSGTQTVYYRFTVPGTSCYTDGKVNFHINIGSTPAVKLNTGVILLKCSGPPSVLFDLYDAVPLLYEGLGNPDFSTNVGMSGVSFYESGADAQNLVNAIVDPANYSVSFGTYKSVWARFQTVSGCFSIVEFRLRQVDNNLFKFQPDPFNIDVCDSDLDGSAIVNLIEWLNNNKLTHPGFFNDSMISAGATYTFLNLDMTPITNPEAFTFSNEIEIYINASANGCTSDSKKITLKVTNSEVLTFTHPPFCRETSLNLVNYLNSQTRLSGVTGYEFYRSSDDLVSGVNRITNDTDYLYEEGINKLFVKILGPSSCPRKGEINLSLKPAPVFTMQEGDYYFCENGGSVQLLPNTSAIYPLGIKPVKFHWTLPDNTVVITTDAIYNANIAGRYQLTIEADNGCTYTAAEFFVKAYEVPKIESLVVEGTNTVKVLASTPNNNRRIMYSNDMINWTYDYIFTNVPPGVQTFYVRFEDNEREYGCIGMPMSTLVLKLNNFITPNGDNVNDTWEIHNLDFYEGKNTDIKIFDRYNKLVFEQSSATEIIWDGYYGGRVLPTSTYWYVLTIPDGRQVTGWILLKNRDND